MSTGSRAIIAVFWLGVIAAVIGLVVLVVGTPFASTPADKVGVIYSGGPLDERSHIGTLDPGSDLTMVGVFNPVYEYPVTVRNYIVSKNPNEGDVKGKDAVTVTSKDGIELDYQVNVYFKLNTNTDTLRSFQNNVAFKYEAWEDEGWDRMLAETFRPQIAEALQRSASKYEAVALYSDAKTRNTVAEEVADAVQENVNRIIGGEYFCGPSYSYGSKECPPVRVTLPKKPDIPKGLKNKLEENRTSEIAVQTKENEAKQAEFEAQRIRTLAETIDRQGAGYIQLEYIKMLQNASANGSVNMIVVPHEANQLLQLPANK